MRKKISLWQCQCERCGHAWITRKEKPPKVCPKCKRDDWNKSKV